MSSAKFWWPVLLPVIERYRPWDLPKFFHGNAALKIRDDPTGRGGRDVKLVRGDSQPYRAADDAAAAHHGAYLVSGSVDGKRGSLGRRSACIQRLTLENVMFRGSGT